MFVLLADLKVLDAERGAGFPLFFVTEKHRTIVMAKRRITWFPILSLNLY